MAQQEAHVGGDTASHRMAVDLVHNTPKKVLMVVANPTVSSNNGWPVGFWAAELTHPYLELTERGVEVSIASPDGGKVEFDNLSDPRDPSKWSAEDLISMGFIHTPELMALLADTPKLADLNYADFDALLICGEHLVTGKTLTGFSNLEEEFGNQAAGVEIMPWRLEDALRERGANYIQGGLFKAFAVRDGRLITGQQQYSGRVVARQVIEMLGL